MKGSHAEEEDEEESLKKFFFFFPLLLFLAEGLQTAVVIITEISIQFLHHTEFNIGFATRTRCVL